MHVPTFGLGHNRPPVDRSLPGQPWPKGVVARIHRPSRSAMTSGRARAKTWVLCFERRMPPFVEPLMGWTGGDEVLAPVRLTFGTLEEAIRYAERQGLAYCVADAATQSGCRRPRRPQTRSWQQHCRRRDAAAGRSRKGQWRNLA